MKKLPKIGAIVKLEWLDSGISIPRCNISPKDVTLASFISYGQIADIDKERIVLYIEREASENEASSVDNHSEYLGVAVVCIKQCVELVPKKK